MHTQNISSIKKQTLRKASIATIGEKGASIQSIKLSMDDMIAGQVL